MKILLLIPSLHAGGAERVMTTLANEWSKENSVTLMVFNDGESFYDLSDRVKLKPLNLMPQKEGIQRYFSIPGIEINRYRSISNEIKQGNYDFVLSFTYTTNMLVSIASDFLRGQKILISERNDPYSYSAAIQKHICWAYKKCKAVICQNKQVKHYFKKHNFHNDLLVLPNPVNFADIPKERPTHIKKEIVTVGRLIPQKNQKLLIEAFDAIKDDYPDYSLKIYGEGPLENELTELIKERKLEDKAYLMGTRQKVMYEVNQASVFVLPSDFEGFPNVLIEAMGTGLPVISSDFKTGVAKSLIRSDQNGYLFRVGDKQDLIDKLRLLLNREDEFLVMGKINKKIAENFEDKKIADKWLKGIANE